MSFTTLAEEARWTLTTLADRAGNVVAPNLRLGVTGLSRAGKTVFITALVHNLLHGGRLPLLRAYSGGRISGTVLQPQPDDAVPRFAYEDHVRALVEERRWPQSTYRISELRLTIDFESASFWNRRLGRGRLHVDIVDYPGEWLLDLPLLTKSYETWSAETLTRARRAPSAAEWLARLDGVDPAAPEDEMLARELAERFTAYLAARRAEAGPLAIDPPGRFLMPGDLAGSPALTFAPLAVDAATPAGSLGRMMARRYDAYRTHVVKPFFREHFARLDRQVVLVDALPALAAGPEAVAELESALGEILAAFRPGRSSWLAAILPRRIDRILLAATKADHLHQEDHDRLEAVLGRLLARPIDRARAAGAVIDILALASVRATREGSVTRGGERLPCILGTPLAGETLGGETFDGKTEIALFPGDLPDDPESIFERPAGPDGAAESMLGHIRFRPPALERTAEGFSLSLPHIRLDRALEFLIGDRLA